MEELRQARRLRPPSWRDGRLVVGVLLILGSVALGVRLVTAADQRVPVYAAARSLVPGERAEEANLVRVEVNLGSAAGAYLPADAGAPEGIVLREVRAGELVPAAALGPPDAAGRRAVVVPVAAGSAQVLAVGSTVDVWVSAARGSSFDPPRALLLGAPVARVPGPDEHRLSTTPTVGVQVMVPEADVAAVIASVDSGSRITLVPQPGSVQREG